LQLLINCFARAADATSCSLRLRQMNTRPGFFDRVASPKRITVVNGDYFRSEFVA
jgi:hypothetical protein